MGNRYLLTVSHICARVMEVFAIELVVLVELLGEELVLVHLLLWNLSSDLLNGLSQLVIIPIHLLQRMRGMCSSVLICCVLGWVVVIASGKCISFHNLLVILKVVPQLLELSMLLHFGPHLILDLSFLFQDAGYLLVALFEGVLLFFGCLLYCLGHSRGMNRQLLVLGDQVRVGLWLGIPGLEVALLCLARHQLGHGSGPYSSLVHVVYSGADQRVRMNIDVLYLGLLQLALMQVAHLGQLVAHLSAHDGVIVWVVGGHWGLLHLGALTLGGCGVLSCSLNILVGLE